MAYNNVLTERRNSTLILTLNRPERLNAWNNDMMFELRDAIEKGNADPSVAAIVFTGAGRAYCSGADIGGWAQAIQAGGGAQGSATAGEDNWLAFLRRMQKPTIAAVNGVAVGVGVTHILPMDIRIASENARFGFAFVKMALVPELASSYYLPQLVGLGRAREWCLTARMVEPAEALAAGLVSEMVAPERLLDRAVEIADIIAQHAPAAVARVKRVLDENATDSNVLSVMLRENAQNGYARQEPDHKEAVAAFLEKRKPIFRR
jgi:enoyl-CoA hydratase/carnithine racemase